MPRLTAEDQVRRDADVVADRARGLTVPTIAARHNLSERQCWEILAKRRQRQITAPEFDPVGVALEAIEEYDSRIEALALLADSAAQESIRLGALKVQLVAMRQRIELMQGVGLLPFEMLNLREKLDVRQVAERDQPGLSARRRAVRVDRKKHRGRLRPRPSPELLS